MFLCVFSDKLHQGDTELFRQLTAQGKPCIFVRNKTDLIYEEGLSLEESEEAIRRDVAGQLGREDFELVFVCARKDAPSGLDELNDANGKRPGAMCAGVPPTPPTTGSIPSSGWMRQWTF